MTADELRRHVRYSGWASRRVLEAARALGAEELERDLGVSHHSLRGTLSHLYDAERIWFARISGGAPVSMSKTPASMEELECDWPAALDRWEYWAWSLTDKDAERVVAYTDTKGRPWENRLADIVRHVVNHASYHRGQVAAMFRQLRHVPPATDLILFEREMATASLSD